MGRKALPHTEIENLGVEPGDSLVVIEINKSGERVGLHAALVIRAWRTKLEVKMNDDMYFVSDHLRFYKAKNPKTGAAQVIFDEYSIIDVAVS